jgi:hypothetical protein
MRSKTTVFISATSVLSTLPSLPVQATSHPIDARLEFDGVGTLPPSLVKLVPIEAMKVFFTSAGPPDVLQFLEQRPRLFGLNP